MAHTLSERLAPRHQRSAVPPAAVVIVALLVTLLTGLLAPAPAQAQSGPVALQSGWNNVTYLGETLPVEQALGDATAVAASVWRWDGQDDGWAFWFPVNPLSTLTVLERGRAYWIRVDAPVEWQQPQSVLFETAQVEIVTAAGSLHLLNVELADSPARRARGLMFRPSLETDAGMLFLFPTTTLASFWMQNTPTALSIAFIDSEGAILEIQDMEPLSTTSHTPAAPYRWALEVNQGWFGAHGVVAGDSVRITGA